MMNTAQISQPSLLDGLLSIGKFNPQGNNSLAACFAELAADLHTGYDIRRICEALPYDTRAFDIVDFINSMANLGYESHSMDIRMDQIDSRLYPCLFIPNEGDSDSSPKVILERAGVNDNLKFTVFDGDSNRRIKITTNYRGRGKVYFFQNISQKDKHNEKQIRKEIGHGWFRVTLERFRGIFAQIFTVSVALSFVSLGSAIFVMMVYDHVVAARSLDKLSMLALGVGIALATEWALRELRSKSLSWFAARLDYIVGNAIFNNLIHMPAAFIEHGSIASQMARIKTFESVRDFFSGPLFLVLVELPFTLIILGAIALISGWLAIIPLAMAAALTLLLAFMRPRMKLSIHTSAKASTTKQQSYIETFEKLHSLKTNGLHDVWVEHFRDISGKASLHAFKTNMLSSLVEVISHAMTIVAGVLIVYFGVLSVIAGNISAGALVATLILVWRVLSPLQILCGSLPRIVQFRQSIEQINRLMDIETELSDKNLVPVDKLQGAISFNKVGLRYSGDSDPVFSGLSFDAAQGELIAIAGANGVGKSTILKLINGLYKPQAGTIRIDGTDIRQISPTALRKQIAYVAQTPEFFYGSIAENLRFAEPLATDKDIREALVQVDALDEVEALKNGINTMIGSGLTSQLPTSLTYRLSLARAYLKNSPILLLDELPYELLASKTGEVFKETLQIWKNIKTVIVVTHRDDFISMSDRAILLRGTEGALIGKPAAILNAIKTSREIH